ncbi:VOC family protein [Chloroflexota bacterium]
MIKKLSHIGIIVNNLGEAKRLWTETYGLKESQTPDTKVEGIKSVFLEVGDNFIELMEPLDHHDMNNAIARRLATKGEGVYHVALIVDDIIQESKKLADKGITLIARPPTEDQPQGRRVIHPKCANGTMLELLS